MKTIYGAREGKAHLTVQQLEHRDNTRTYLQHVNRSQFWNKSFVSQYFWLLLKRIKYYLYYSFKSACNSSLKSAMNLIPLAWDGKSKKIETLFHDILIFPWEWSATGKTKTGYLKALNNYKYHENMKVLTKLCEIDSTILRSAHSTYRIYN